MDFRPTRFNILPPVVKNLLIINGLLFIASIILGKQGIDLYEHLALYHWSSEKFKVWQIVTHMFMHGGDYNNAEAGFMHLFSNMFALWMFGSTLENFMGSKRFLTFYMLCGIGASLIYLGILNYEYMTLKDAIAHFNANPTFKEYSSFLSQNYSTTTNLQDPFFQLKARWEYDPNSIQMIDNAKYLLHQYYQQTINVPTVGASGAVFGLLFAFGYLFPNTVLYIQFFFPLKAKYFVALYAAFELYAGIQNSAGDNIAHSAHLGGMLIAFIILKIWNKTNRKNFY